MATSENLFVALDGLRGLAMLGVMLNHIGLFPLGWISLQVFFVLSGFLITRLLFEDKERQTRSECLQQFYLRRIYRIFPAYYVYLLFVLIMTYLYAPAASIRQFIPDAAIYVHNFSFTFYEGPFVPDSGWFFIRHLWSLAVEEHFYLLWPLLILFTPSRHYRAMILATYLAAIALRLAIYVVWHPEQEQALGAFVPMAIAMHMVSGTQFDAFALGALIALMYREGGIRQPRLMFIVALVAAGVMMSVSYTEIFGSVDRVAKMAWKYSVANLLCASIVMLTLTHPHVIRWIGRPVLNWVGKISYSMYLWHMPLAYLTLEILQAMSGSLDRSLLLILLVPLYVGATCFIGWLSHTYVESYFMRIRPRRHAGQSHTEKNNEVTVA